MTETRKCERVTCQREGAETVTRPGTWDLFLCQRHADLFLHRAQPVTVSAGRR
jgi:hypothetical protein